MNTWRFILFVMSALLVTPLAVSAQVDADTPLIRFGSFINGPIEVHVTVASAGLEYSNLSPNILTSYASVEAGEHVVEFTASGEGATANTLPPAETIVIQEGHTYTVVINGLEQSDIIIVDETGLNEEAPLAEGENSLIIVTQAATGTGEGASSFTIAENSSPTPRDRQILEYHGYLRTGFGINERLQRVDPQSGEEIYSVNIPYFPNTSIVISGDWRPDEGGSPVLNFSTNLSVADWLAGVNQMENPPFTFNQFLNTAQAGGFAGALDQCPDYMWNVFTDAAAEALASDLQARLRQQAGIVMDNSVLNPATTMPWLISPTQTRGGSPLVYINEFGLLDSDPPEASSDTISGSILMTLSTTGNSVQNVVHIVDNVPVASDDRVGVEWFFDR